MIEESGDYYFRTAFATYINRLEHNCAEANEMLERYYPDGKYIGGISTHYELNRMMFIAEEIKMMIAMLPAMLTEHIAIYQEHFVPFKTSYDESLNEFRDLGSNIQYYSADYSDAFNALESTFSTLFSDAEKYMCDGMSIYDRIDELNERLAGANDCVERMRNIAAVTDRELNTYENMFKKVEAECPDVFEYYREEFWRIDSEWYAALQANGGVKKIIYNQEHTDIYILTVEKLIEDIENVAAMAYDAQARYYECEGALEYARNALDEAWAAVMSECPDVYMNYQLTFDGFESELEDLTRGLSGAFQSQDAADSFMQSLSDLSKRIEEAVVKAREEQSNSAGVEGVEAAGNGDAEYYDLNGAKVTNPRPGTVVIKVDAAGKTAKVVIR